MASEADMRFGQNSKEKSPWSFPSKCEASAILARPLLVGTFDHTSNVLPARAASVSLSDIIRPIHTAKACIPSLFFDANSGDHG